MFFLPFRRRADTDIAMASASSPAADVPLFSPGDAVVVLRRLIPDGYAMVRGVVLERVPSLPGVWFWIDVPEHGHEEILADQVDIFSDERNGNV